MIYKKKLFIMDGDMSVLNLGSFGDVIRKDNREEPKSISPGGFLTYKDINKNIDEPIKGEKTETTNDAVSCMAAMVIKHTAQIKMFHWQTNSYAEHKALDLLFGSIVTLSDSLIETAMGKYGRPNLTQNSDIAISNYSTSEDLVKYMDYLFECFGLDCKEKFANDPGIVSILDDMLAEIDKIKYLLTLK